MNNKLWFNIYIYLKIMTFFILEYLIIYIILFYFIKIFKKIKKCYPHVIIIMISYIFIFLIKLEKYIYIINTNKI